MCRTCFPRSFVIQWPYFGSRVTRLVVGINRVLINENGGGITGGDRYKETHEKNGSTQYDNEPEQRELVKANEG